MFKNKPVKSRTIWISLLTSMFYLAMIAEAIGAFAVTPQNISRQDIAQADLESDTEKPVAEEPEIETENTLEKAIIAELNRVRTNPQGYADWLESQKQYYQGMLLKLPGEQPIRTNRGLRSLEEAITFLRQQQELPALSPSTELTSAARQQITAITNDLQINSNNLVYGKVTPEAIVMQLVVDDGFPDRPHRLAIFNRNHQNTGIACSEIPVYNKVCAIAYTQSTEARQPVAINTEETTENGSQIPTPPEVDTSTIEKTENNPEATPANSESDVIVTTKPASENAPEVVNRNQTDNTNTSTSSESEVTENPTVEEEQPEAITESPPENNIDSETEITANPTVEEQPETITESPPENNIDSETEITANPTVEEQPETITESLAENNIDSETTATTDETNLDVATSNTNNLSQAVEIVERGTLEEGDSVIPNDGSFYDSYPIEGSAGDSFTITLESQDFDTFLAIMDREGNIIEQNDDVNEQDSNSRLEITLPDDGTYSVIVNAYEQQGTGNYVLTVSR